ncbi:MAG: hypothetical protein J5J00_07310, partial [Deltaproteobacteria bacterium]|nr:hypothetical protein [Deltaproteobacteria bacterium]
ASLVITLYGAVHAHPSRRSLYVLMGIALQFSIKANVFVTLAMLAGYFIFEAGMRCFLLDERKTELKEVGQYLARYSLLFLALLSVAACLMHYEMSHLYIFNDNWRKLIGGETATLQEGFAAYKYPFLAVLFVVALIVYVLSFFVFRKPHTLFGRAWQNIVRYKWQFAGAVVIASVVFCYIATSGFRNADGVLDVVFRKSIPYWWNQHKIERIQGPFLFHVYMFAWYELVFLGLLVFQMYLFYRSAGRWTKIGGGAMLFVATFFSLLTLYYTAPSGAGHWIPVSELHKREAGGLWKVLFAVWGEFKVKDCLDIFGLFILLIHPVILTFTHASKREYTLAFWGYFFTASFFSYSFVGEKVPWLAMYPLFPGMVYLALYFDDWFKRHPIKNYRSFPLERILRWCGLVMLILAVFFVLETIFSLSALFAGQMGKKVQELTPSGSLLELWRPIVKAVEENLLMFVLGFLLYGMYYFNRWIKLLGNVNLKIFLFAALGIYCIRMAIITNFVHAGEESEYISQVHTTKEFHEVALRLRHLSLTNLRGDPVMIYGDGDPVWPLTWYMIGVENFKFIASPEERKNFDYMLLTWDEKGSNIPEGWERRRVNLRGWWVPDFNQMTLKKFLVYAVNHFPWSNTGFTYVWLLSNPAKQRAQN